MSKCDQIQFLLTGWKSLSWKNRRIFMRALREYRERLSRQSKVHGTVKIDQDTRNIVSALTALDVERNGGALSDCAGTILIPETLSRGSKAGSAASLLEQFSIKYRSFESLNVPTINYGSRLRRTLFNLEAKVVDTLIGLNKKNTKARDVLFMKWCFVAFKNFRKFDCRNILIISDLSAKRLTLAAGARSAGVSVFWYQDDYHHRSIPNEMFSDAIVLSGEAEIDAKNKGVRTWAAPAPVLKSMQLSASIRTVGLAINAYPQFESSELAQSLLKHLGCSNVEVRLHPRRAPQSRTIRGGFTIGPAGETIEKFASRCDLVVCGNTAAQLKLVQQGCMVAHVAGLDYGGFDNYGFVRAGSIPGFRRLEDLDFRKILDHYQNPNYLETIRTHLGGRPSESGTLYDLRCWLKARRSRVVA